MQIVISSVRFEVAMLAIVLFYSVLVFAQLAMDDSVPLPGAVQAKLRAGDAVVYILPLLHWASDYSTKVRRTVHGGFSEFNYYPGLDSYLHTLSPTAQQVRETALKLSS